ncbi:MULTISPECIES: hypothetical protein [Amycolatopsis]|uniref:Uncharacterized protein n=1 Tax=Amycolatopsis albidoflavus TaxID=102226 RepID=A0ABW5ICN4_9PSEU
MPIFVEGVAHAGILPDRALRSVLASWVPSAIAGAATADESASAAANAAVGGEKRMSVLRLFLWHDKVAPDTALTMN